jgi:hypothetical protein
MIEADIEAGLVSAIETLLPTATVASFWEATPTGRQKMSQASFILVIVKPKGNRQETIPTYSCNVDIIVRSGAEDDPTGSIFAAQSAVICGLAQAWNGPPGSLERAALVAALAGTGYTVTGLEESDGDCGFDLTESSWYCAKPLTIHFITS